jgi:hypothetical protein
MNSYQIAAFADGAESHAETLRNTIRRNFAGLGISLDLLTKSGKYFITVPTVGVPDAVRYREIEDEIGRHLKRQSDIVLLYEEGGIRDKWMNHIAWLDRRQSAVKSLQVAQAQFWLGGLR